jgi:hypothetical protein
MKCNLVIMKFQVTDVSEGYGASGMRRARARGRGRRARMSEGRTSPEQRQQVRAWVAGRIPAEWAVEPAEVRVDDDEVLVLAHLPAVALGDDATETERATAEAARIGGFREETRQRRMHIADEGAAALDRMLSWGATCGGTTLLFTTASVPVMTRLRIDERLVLDTLVDAGVARSRSDALAWCVRLVGRNEDQWISDLRAAFEQVEEVRSRGPAGGA